MFTKQELIDAVDLVHARAGSSPQIQWPLLSARVGADVVVKHENHLPTGAFKVRGAITYLNWLAKTNPSSPGIITSTRGNHGQAQARAATALGKRAVIYAPFGNSTEKNAAMRAFGAELIEFGNDYDEARVEAHRVAQEQGLDFVPPYHKELVRGVATYGFELFSAHPDLDAVYVPVGCGSGICATIAARDAMGVKAKIIGVVPEGADCVKQSFEAGRLIETNTVSTFADGTAVRIPVRAAFDVYSRGAERIVSVSDDQIADAVRAYYTDTHNLAEGAGAETLAALVKEADQMAGKKVAVILSGGNIDAAWFRQILDGNTPKP